jgi:hypothetical protein
MDGIAGTRTVPSVSAEYHLIAGAEVMEAISMCSIKLRTPENRAKYILCLFMMINIFMQNQ